MPTDGHSLADLRILDLSRVLAGPYATMILGDLGADVLKVEHPTGDETRRWGPPFRDSHSTYFLAINRNKRSVAIDLKSDDGAKRLRCLLRAADVVIHNFRPSTAKRLGLDDDSIRDLNGAAIVCAITGYGMGDGRDLPGYDFLAQAESGLMSLTGDRNPTKVGVAVVDVITGMNAAIGVLAAVRHRERTGKGQFVSVDLMSSAVSALVNQASAFLNAGVVGATMGNAHPSIAPYQSFRTADSAIAIAVGTDEQFRTLCGVVGLAGLASEPDFATNGDRVRNRVHLARALESKFVDHPTEYWLPRLGDRGVPCAPVRDVAGAFERAAALDMDLTFDLTLSDGTVAAQVANPIQMTRTPARYDLPPPLLDEHAADVWSSKEWPSDPA